MTPTTQIKNRIARLAPLSGINAYSVHGAGVKMIMHRDGLGLMRGIAALLQLREGTYEVRSNRGGIAVSGEVTLHHERVYVWLQESCVGGRGLQIIYRTCEGRGDYSGGMNQRVYVRELLDDEVLGRFLLRVARMIDRAAAIQVAA